jgi:hypothetical protein
MPRHSAGTRSAGAGSTTLPVGSLYAAAAAGAAIREIGAFNTTTTEVAIMLTRLTTAGTQGANLVEAAHDQNKVVPQCTAVGTHTSTPPTLGDDLGYRALLGAAKGAGVIWTFGDTGIVIPEGTGNGVGILVATGTGQILDWYIVWDE